MQLAKHEVYAVVHMRLKVLVEFTDPPGKALSMKDLRDNLARLLELVESVLDNEH